MTKDAFEKVVGHALDHRAYGWCPGLPVRHDGRPWTEDERAVYNEVYRENRVPDSLVRQYVDHGNS